MHTLLLEMATSTTSYWYGFALISIDRYWIVDTGTGYWIAYTASTGYWVFGTLLDTWNVGILVG